MPGISDYDALKVAIADWLIRTDLTSVIPTFVDNFESAARRDPRVKFLTSVALSVTSVEMNLPVDYRGVESLWHDGPTFFGEIETVGAGQLGRLGGGSGATGVVCYAALNPDARIIRFAPPPSATYALKLWYWATIERLSDNLQSNWLLDEHPDIYLYGSLIESAPYLQQDVRVNLWRAEYERRLSELHAKTQEGQWSGSLVRMPARSFNVR